MATREQSRQQSLERQAQWRELRKAGRTTREIAAHYGVSRALVSLLTKGSPGERICGSCCQPLMAEVELPKRRKK